MCKSYEDNALGKLDARYAAFDAQYAKEQEELAAERQHQYIVFYAIDQQPIRENMALPVSDPITRKGVVFVLVGERFAL